MNVTCFLVSVGEIYYIYIYIYIILYIPVRGTFRAKINIDTENHIMGYHK